MSSGRLISKEEVRVYFENLGKLPLSSEVTDANNAPLTFESAVDQVIKLAIETHEKSRKLIFIGNGGSSAIASHMAIDYTKNGGIRATTFSDGALLTCFSNDYGYEQVYQKPIEMYAQPEDLLIAISSSGTSPNILNAVRAARERQCRVVTFSGFKPDNPLRKLGIINFYVPSNAYGFVEITHLSLCHAILDFICELNKKGSLP